ncbi:DUF1327 domain-containing protein [Enterobacter sp.]|uniref:DUF1327 domain-containing protein n=1 Tax=Enterobacter sp. TaxID=42895 RepID=UPI00296E772A|nr:DUF1327 domain-containing protein [Enterobacter sp.]
MVKKYALEVQYIAPKQDRVDVTIAVVYAQFTGITVFTVQLSIERNEVQPLSYYEEEALIKAALLINSIADELKEAA